jgi:hypothetical protein
MNTCISHSSSEVSFPVENSCLTPHSPDTETFSTLEICNCVCMCVCVCIHAHTYSNIGLELLLRLK